MTEASYFKNHALGRRFPWSLYHAPIDRALKAFLRDLPNGARVLNVGCGTFLNLPELPRHVRYTGTDIDPRAIDACISRYGTRDHEFVRSEPLSLPFAGNTFDAAYATEVIEHSERPEAWVRELMRVVKRGGEIFLTTPNYGSLSLDLIEKTVLEAIARVQGFTRRGIHPSPWNAVSLERLLRSAGAVSPRIEVISLGWVLAARFSVP